MEVKRSTEVLPPANGKKLWRVKRSTGSGKVSNPDQTNSSNECLQNSLKISAAGNQYSLKRSPLRRPKNKPGMPKDFVFVDLSPIKTESEMSDEDSVAESQFSSPESAVERSTFDNQHLNDSLSSISSDDDSMFSAASTTSISEPSHFQSMDALDAYMQAHPSHVTMLDDPMGLGITGIDWNANVLQPHNAQQCHQQSHSHSNTECSQLDYNQAIQFQELQQQFNQSTVSASGLPSPAESESKFSPIHIRSKSTSDVRQKKKSGNTFQFKQYNGPNAPKRSKPQLKHRHTISEPYKGKASYKAKSRFETSKNNFCLEDFMLLNDQLQINLRNEKLNGREQASFMYSPISEPSHSDDKSLNGPMNLDNSLFNCNSSDYFMTQIPEFDLDAFVAF